MVRGRAGWGFAVAWVLGAIWLAPPASADDYVCPAEPPARATVLYFHPGGFVEGEPSDPDNVAICREFAAHGYETRVVEYPLFDVPGAARAARAAARRERSRTYAVGDSAGGTLAALLTVEGAVDGGLTWAAPTDLLTWPTDQRAWRRFNATRRERVAVSPYHQVSPRAGPLLLMHDPRDIVVPFAQATKLARRAPAARVRRVRGDFLAHTWAAPDRGAVLAWLDELEAR